MPNHSLSRISRFAVYLGLPVAVIMAAAMIARAYDTTWIVTGQTLSAAKLKADLDEAQVRLAALEASAGGVPAGTIVPFAGTTVPKGWLPCDGTKLDGTNPKYAALYMAIGTAWGGNSVSDEFNLPDLRGRFLRGVDTRKMNNNDPDAASRTASQAGGNTGAQVGSLEGHQFASHDHGGMTGKESGSFGNGILYNSSNHQVFTLNINGSVLPVSRTDFGEFHTHSITASGGSETRPSNAAVNYIIKL